MHPLNPILASAVFEQVDADRRAAAAPRRLRRRAVRRDGSPPAAWSRRLPASAGRA